MLSPTTSMTGARASDAAKAGFSSSIAQAAMADARNRNRFMVAFMDVHCRLDRRSRAGRYNKCTVPHATRCLRVASTVGTPHLPWFQPSSIDTPLDDRFRDSDAVPEQDRHERG